MVLSKEEKLPILESYQQHEGDTGSADVQVAVLTARINALTEHLRIHRHDESTRRGLLKMVGRRNSLLRFLSRTRPENYRDTIKRLGLRK